jgi:hypothetical protein
MTPSILFFVHDPKIAAGVASGEPVPNPARPAPEISPTDGRRDECRPS